MASKKTKLYDAQITKILMEWNNSEDELDSSDIEENEDNDPIIDEDLFDINNLPCDIIEEEEAVEKDTVNVEETAELSQFPTNIFNINACRDLIWKKKNLIMEEEKLAFNKTNLPVEVMQFTSPIEFFRYFFTQDCLLNIVEQSNLYASQINVANPTRLTKNDIEKFIGICLYTSIVQISNVRNYWNSHIGFEKVRDTMSQKHFEKIRRFIHFNDNNKMLPNTHEHHDRLYKIRPLFDHLNQRFQSIPYERDLSLDEQICATKARSYMKQYLPMKPHKWGYKLFILSSVSGFAYCMEVYTGQENFPKFRKPSEPDIGASGNVVVRLTRSIPNNCNHRIYFDNYYTSIALIVYLAKKGIYSLGTVRRNRIPNCKLPNDEDLKKAPRGTSDELGAVCEGVDISSVIWKDNKIVTLLSSYCGVLPITIVERHDKKQKQRIPVQCPNIITEYNRHMGGVDLLDSFIGRSKIRMRSKKWYMRLFYHFLDLTVVNAWVLYRLVEAEKGNKNRTRLIDFKGQIAHSLVQTGGIKLSRGRPSSSLEGQLQAKKKRGPACTLPEQDIRKDQTSHWPQQNEIRQRCKYPGCKGFSFISCSKCAVHLCLNKTNNCFLAFHNE